MQLKKLDDFARFVWWMPKSFSLAPAQRERLAFYTMGHCPLAQAKSVIVFFGHDWLLERLQHPIPGILNPERWNFWSKLLGNVPVPPMPKRFADVPDFDWRGSPVWNRHITLLRFELHQ